MASETVADIIEKAHNREVSILRDALTKIYKCVNNSYGVDVSTLVKSIIKDVIEVGE